MATKTYYTDKKAAMENENKDKGINYNVIDFGSQNEVSGDTIQALNIKAGTYVEKVCTRIITAEGGTLTFDIGDATDPNGWNDAVDGNAAATTVTKTLEATDPYGAGKYYAADDTIDILLDNDADTAVIEIWAEYRMATKQDENVVDQST